MSLALSAWSIRNPVAVSLLFILLTLAGLAGFRAMKVQDFPDIDFPIVIVRAGLPGASPAQLESEVARKLEDVIAALRGIRHIKTSLSDGMAVVTAEFEVGKPPSDAMNEVRDAVTRIRSRLPADLNDPVITQAELASTPVLTYALTSTRRGDEDLSWFADSQVARQLLGVPGVGAVRRVGGADREILIALSPGQLLALDATALDISRQLRATQQEAASGRARLGGAEQSVRTVATMGSAAEIAALEIALPDGRRLRLDQVATVSDTVTPPRSAALWNHRPVVGLEILRARGASELDVAQATRAVMATLRDEHRDVELIETVSAVDPIRDNYRGSMMLLLEGAVLAVLVVFLFLRDARATFVAAVALPLSAIPTFAVMHLMGFSLNTVSLLALSLVVGVLVDDAIVEVENIERHLLMRKTPLQAADDATREIGLAVVATTFTLIAVFLPTSLMGGQIGQYFVQFGWTAAVAVFFSLVVARMLTPTLAACMLRRTGAPARRARWVTRYIHLVRLGLRHRIATLALATLTVAGGLALAAGLPGEFIPADDADQTRITIELAPGSELDHTLRAARRAVAIAGRHPHVRSVFTAIGAGGEGGSPQEGADAASSVTRAVLTATLTPRAEREGATRQQVERELREALAVLDGVRVRVGAGDDDGLEIVLTGDDGPQLAAHAARVERELRQVPGVGAVTSSSSLVRPELVVRPNVAHAAELGVTSSAIAETLRVATVGDHDEDLAKLDLGERQVPIVVRLSRDDAADLDLLRRLPVPGTRGPVPLESVATLALVDGPAELTRYDRRRNISLQVELGGQPLGRIEAAADALPSLARLPQGIARSQAGEAEVMGELIVGFGVAMAAGIVCVYAVLVLLLKDFAQPFTVLVALVLSIPGAFLALWLTGASLSMPSMIGLIMLMGITTKNAILLVDYIVMARREHGMGRTRAIVDACRKRVRPIVMTTVAMGAGMLPIALGLGADPSFRAPMAIVVIGGLATSTILCLVVVPVVYSSIDDAVLRLRHPSHSRRRAQPRGVSWPARWS